LRTDTFKAIKIIGSWNAESPVRFVGIGLCALLLEFPEITACGLRQSTVRNKMPEEFMGPRV